jgi:hypothetical protein
MLLSRTWFKHGYSKHDLPLTGRSRPLRSDKKATTMNACHNDYSHGNATKALYTVTFYQGWPVAHYYFCDKCYDWSLRNRPDLYFIDEAAALAESVTRNLAR